MPWTWTTIYYIIIIITIITTTVFYVQYLYVFISHVIEEHIILHLTGWRGSPLLSFSRVFFANATSIMYIYILSEYPTRIRIWSIRSTTVRCVAQEVTIPYGRMRWLDIRLYLSFLYTLLVYRHYILYYIHIGTIVIEHYACAHTLHTHLYYYYFTICLYLR